MHLTCEGLSWLFEELEGVSYGGTVPSQVAAVPGASAVGCGLDMGVTCGWSSPTGLRHMSGSELTELLDQVEGAIRDFSEELVQQLARRDELEFEKEVKNSFITVLIEVQNKQKEQRELMKKRRKEKGLSLQSSRIEKGNQMPLKRFSMEGISNILQSGIRQTFGSSGTDKQYLNTVIPYEKKASPPSVEDLQMLTNILFAMKEDNEKVPTLLTDYILKVLCPT
ncbi:fasciculation and elongation protein zeta 1 [Rhinolophus ferrumequinum]|uniref:Fasciculation and elongation protein zeta 1 n=1 Tax=Rhinolophus ferrumequinum TaxID=59479 RepID=A0A7J7RP93_RHIFE|nr:fasciculation and elongation protein zeta 1 [Rhinolophus ferrumequinum]